MAVKRHRYGEVDSSENPSDYVDLMDLLRRQPAVQRLKGDSFRQLGLSQGMYVLDVGCGSGDEAAAMADIVAP